MPSPETSRLSPERFFELVKEQERLRKKINSGNFNALQLKPDHVQLSAVTSQITKHQQASLTYHEQDLKKRDQAGRE